MIPPQRALSRRPYMRVRGRSGKASYRALGRDGWKSLPPAHVAPAWHEALVHPGSGLADVSIDASGYGAQLVALEG